MKNLIQFAKENASKIAKATKNAVRNKKVAVYEGENGFVISTLQQGWSTRKNEIVFGDEPMTKKQVLRIIAEYETPDLIG